ncbi:MAG: phosphoserine aminotransferase, partial [Pseudomonadota bacterium]
MAITAPDTRPANPRFSSGPCAKPPTFSLDALRDAPLGRSHRAAEGKARLKQAIEETRDILGVPADYKIGIVPASDTGAYEMAMWTMLGARPA